MTFNHRLVDEFLEAIFPLPEQFGVIISDDDETTEPIDYSLIQEVVWDVDPDASVYFGMSKLVIVAPSLNGVVIKIPFNGRYYEDCEGELHWVPFEWATGSDKSDYCLTEYEKYNRLKTYGLNCFVAKTIFYGIRCGVRVFIQEEVTSQNDLYQTRRPSEKSSNLANKWYDEGKFYIEPEWIANCLDKYGESKVERFLYYCSNIDPDILEDMHDGNFGYRPNELPVLLDYSNYND